MIGPDYSRTFIVVELPRWDRKGRDPYYGDEAPPLRRSRRAQPSEARQAVVKPEAPRVRLLPGMSPSRRSGW